MTEQGTDTQQQTGEREILSAYVAARNEKERLEAKLSAATADMLKAQADLIKHLEDAGKKSTGKYTDLGCFLLTQPIATFKVPGERKDDVTAWVKEIGAGAVIKETIHHATLQSLFRERFEKDQPLPDYVEMSMIAQGRYTRPEAAPQQ